jgi:single-strand DNA-binding protein
MLNNIIIMGRLVKAPELKSTKSGISVLSFSVANERDFAKGEEKKTDFIDCVA